MRRDKHAIARDLHNHPVVRRYSAVMRLTLAQQFVLATLTLTLAVLLATLLLARWSFERGFLEYVRELEYKRLEEVAAELLVAYDAQRGWQDLSRRSFLSALRIHGADRHRPGMRGPGMRGPADMRRPLQALRADRPDAAPPEGPFTRVPRVIPTALFDADGRLVAAFRFTDTDARSETLRYPMRVDDVVVGELRSQPRRRLESAQETRFARKQRQASLLIFAVALALALLMAVLLSRRLLAPLRRAHQALAAMAGGDYGQRLDTGRRDELGELMNDVDHLARTLSDNQETRQRWIADISHELRTPVAILKGELDAMADGVRPMDGQQLDSLRAEVARLAKLIEDLFQLSLADIGGLRYEFRTVDLGTLVSDICADYQRRFADRELVLTVEVEGPCQVHGDAQRLEQLLRNLLENSLAYTDSPGEVRVTLSCTGGRGSLVVLDSAPGVAPERCEQLFDPLYRQDGSRSRHSAGAGLGLAIARAVAEAHQGCLTAAPSDLGGLAVTFSLPLQQGR